MSVLYAGDIADAICLCAAPVMLGMLIGASCNESRDHYVLDPCPAILSDPSRFVQTSFETGIQDEHVERAIAILHAEAPPGEDPSKWKPAEGLVRCMFGGIVR